MNVHAEVEACIDFSPECSSAARGNRGRRLENSFRSSGQMAINNDGRSQFNYNHCKQIPFHHASPDWLRKQPERRALGFRMWFDAVARFPSRSVGRRPSSRHLKSLWEDESDFCDTAKPKLAPRASQPGTASRF